MKTKKEEGNNYAVFYLFLILFFGWILTQFIVINYNSLIITDNQITGLQTTDVSGSISNALRLLGQIFTPIIEGIGNDSNAILLRVFYAMLIFFIISPILSKLIKEEKETRLSRARTIAGILSLLAAIGVPTEFLLTLNESLFLFALIGVVFGGLYFIYIFRRGEENRFIYFFKAVFSLILFTLIGTVSSYARTKFSITGGTIDLVISFGLLISIVFFIWYLLIKTVSGGPAVEETNQGNIPGESLRRAGQAYAGVGAPVATGVSNLWNRMRGRQPTGQPNPAQAARRWRQTIQQALQSLNLLSNQIDNQQNWQNSFNYMAQISVQLPRDFPNINTRNLLTLLNQGAAHMQRVTNQNTRTQAALRNARTFIQRVIVNLNLIAGQLP